MSANNDKPVIEPPQRCEGPDLTLRALNLRIRQQEILAELGVSALHGATLEKLLEDTARLTAEGLESEFCKVLEHLPGENALIIRAGVGWKPGVVGQARIGADLASPAGFALRTGKPVISNHLENEERFRTPEILQRHHIRRAMNVILQGDGRPFGVLEVDSRSDSEFSEHDLAFLQGAANILGMAIERERRERSLKGALDRHQYLLKEMNHRVKNSLAIVASMLQLQAKDADDDGLTEHLKEASHRVSAVARAHDQLFRNADFERLDVGKYVESVSKDLDASVAQCEIEIDIEYGMSVATDRAISTALIVNELITNAAKYAYGGRAGGKVRVALRRAGGDAFTVRVSDAGVGLPADFDARKSKSLGMRIVRAFVLQLKGTLSVSRLAPGAEFAVTVPLEASPP
jgi:two-component sensor histidine kinase